MRTNIEIDDKLMGRAMALSGKSTKKSVVDEALRLAVQLKRQAGIRELWGKVKWEGNLDEMRQGRFMNWQEDAERAEMHGPSLSAWISSMKKVS
jgi:Arc/MetJ family transcription regulator